MLSSTKSRIENLHDVLITLIDAEESGDLYRLEVQSCGDWEKMSTSEDMTFYLGALYRVTFPKRKLWVNVYPSGNMCTHKTKACADEKATSDRVRCMCVEESDN